MNATQIEDAVIAAIEEVNERLEDLTMITPSLYMIVELLKSASYKERATGEYWFVKDKYEKLHRMIVRREAGTLDFTPNCPMEQWKAQAAAMGAYLFQLEIKAEIEGINLDDVFESTSKESAN